MESYLARLLAAERPTMAMIASTTPMAPRMAAILVHDRDKAEDQPQSAKDDAYGYRRSWLPLGVSCAGVSPLIPCDTSILLLDLGELCTIHAIGVRTVCIQWTNRSFPIALSGR